MEKAEADLSPHDGNHYFGYVSEIMRRKRNWEEATTTYWTKRSQLLAGKTMKLSALNKSIFEQVESIMEDTTRWKKRCTVVRGDSSVAVLLVLNR